MKKIFYTLALAAAVTFSANAQTNTTEQAETTAPATTGPRIEFEKQVHDYGQITMGADGNCEFKFKNTGTEPLVLNNVQSSCGCTVPSWTREPVMPGQEGSIKVRYDTNRIGHIGKAITVYSNSVGDNSERITLRISGNVNPKQN